MTGDRGANSELLLQQLNQELGLTLSLQNCLGQERQALEQRDSDALVDNASHKDQLVQQLQQAAQLREQFLAQQGLPVDRNGMQQLLEQLNNPQLDDCWQKLSNAAEQCREENRQLGMLIQREQGNIYQAQHILQRGTTASKPFL